MDPRIVANSMWIQCLFDSQCWSSVRGTVKVDAMFVAHLMGIQCQTVHVDPVSANVCGPIVGRSVWIQLQIIRLDTLRTVRMDPVSIRPCRSSFRVCVHPVSDIEWTDCPTVRVDSMYVSIIRKLNTIALVSGSDVGLEYNNQVLGLLNRE